MARRSSRLTLALLLALSTAGGVSNRHAIACSFGPTRIVERMLSIPEIERLQVRSLYDGRTRLAPADPDEWTYAGETWREVPIGPLREAEQKCPVLARYCATLVGLGFDRHFADCHLTSMGAPS